MKEESTSIRIRKLMEERGLRQVDILDKCKPFCEKYDIKLGRNDLSQYVSGKVEPGQEKLTVLGLALNVSEAWLMGFNVPMERVDRHNSKEKAEEILKYYGMLNDLGKETATEQVRLLTLDEKYTKITSVIREPDADYLIPNAAHDKPDATEEEKAADNASMDDETIWKK